MTYPSIRRQYALNATQLELLANRAKQGNGTANGLPEAFWRERARLYRKLSESDDETIREHLRSAQQTAAERLMELQKSNLGVPEHSVRKTLRERTLKVGRVS